MALVALILEVVAITQARRLLGRRRRVARSTEEGVPQAVTVLAITGVLAIVVVLAIIF